MVGLSDRTLQGRSDALLESHGFVNVREGSRLGVGLGGHQRAETQTDVSLFEHTSKGRTSWQRWCSSMVDTGFLHEHAVLVTVRGRSGLAHNDQMVLMWMIASRISVR